MLKLTYSEILYLSTLARSTDPIGRELAQKILEEYAKEDWKEENE